MSKRVPSQHALWVSVLLFVTAVVLSACGHVSPFPPIVPTSTTVSDENEGFLDSETQLLADYLGISEACLLHVHESLHKSIVISYFEMGKQHFAGIYVPRIIYVYCNDAKKEAFVFHNEEEINIAGVHPDAVKPIFASFTIYRVKDDAWEVIDTLDSADYLSIMRIDWVDSNDLWFFADIYTAPYTDLWKVIRFDGSRLIMEYDGCNEQDSHFQDINGDGYDEIIGTTCDYVVLSYHAADVTNVGKMILQWDGTRFTEVKLEKLPDSAPESLSELNNRAVVFAQADLWLDAASLISKALKISEGPFHETVKWNAILVNLNIEAKKDQIIEDDDSGFGYATVMAQMFLGDYLAAVDVFRSYPVEAIFADSANGKYTRPSELLAANGGGSQELTKKIFALTDKSLALMDEDDAYREKRAAAYFLRAWAAYTVNPTDPRVMENLAKAHQLAPDDTLYDESLNYLQRESRSFMEAHKLF